MRRILWLMAAILLLVQPVTAIDCSLAGIDGIQVSALVQCTDNSTFGDSALYASMIKNQLVQNGVHVNPDREPHSLDLRGEFTNGALLSFHVIILEPYYKKSGIKSGHAFFSIELLLSESIMPRRSDSTGHNFLRLPQIEVVIWRMASVGYNPERSDVKSAIKEELTDWVQQFVAELRDANSPSFHRENEEFWREMDEWLEEVTKESGESKE